MTLLHTQNTGAASALQHPSGVCESDDRMLPGAGTCYHKLLHAHPSVLPIIMGQSGMHACHAVSSTQQKALAFHLRHDEKQQCDDCGDRSLVSTGEMTVTYSAGDRQLFLHRYIFDYSTTKGRTDRASASRKPNR